MILLRQRIPPFAFVNSATKDPGFGMFARMLSPAYFNIPVEGELNGTRLILKAQPAIADFSSLVENKLFLLAVPSFVVPVPAAKTFHFPIEKAQFIISRAL